MAFSTSNVVRENLGSTSKVRGNWAGLDTDTANGTLVGSGYATSALFMTNNSVGPENVIGVRISNSSGTWTVTIPYSYTVTNGTFEVSFK